MIHIFYYQRNSIEDSIELLPITKEKYISFAKNVKERSNSRNNNIKLFIDSYKFLSRQISILS